MFIFYFRFTWERHNDLITPRKEEDFPGLKEGDSWCLCALRWKEALNAGRAPPVKLDATLDRAIECIAMGDLKNNSIPESSC